MRIKYFFATVICAVGLWAPRFALAQGILTVSNTNQPVIGDYVETYGTRIPFTVGFDQGGYQLTGFAVEFGDNAAADFPNVTVALYGANSPINLDTEISSITIPVPRAAGLYFISWPYNTVLPGQNIFTGKTYYDFFVAPQYSPTSADGLSLAYTTSTNSTNNAGWEFYPNYSSINGEPGYIPLFNIFATVLPPPKLYPIHLTNEVAMANGNYRFGFTNSPGFNFSVYLTTNVAQPFTNWFYSGSAEYQGTNYYQYETGPGITTNANYPTIYFRVSSP